MGYNRRFSVHTRLARQTFEARDGPLSIHYSISAGIPPAGTWITDPAVGGGRVLGEVCHFVDLCSHLVGKMPSRVFASALGRDPETDDSVVATLGWPDGSAATIQYLASANSNLPKERFEASADGSTVRCDNYRRTEVLGGRTLKTWNQDKGQTTAIAETVGAVARGDTSPIPLIELAGVARATFAIADSIRSGEVQRLDE